MKVDFLISYPVVFENCDKLLYLVAFPHHSYADDDPRLPLAGAKGVVVGLVVEVRGGAALRCGGRGGRRRRRGGGRGRGKSSRELGHIFFRSGNFYVSLFHRCLSRNPSSPSSSTAEGVAAAPSALFPWFQSVSSLFFVFLSPPTCRRKAQCLAKIEGGIEERGGSQSPPIWELVNGLALGESVREENP